MVRTQRFHCHGLGSIPGRGTKILQASPRGQNIYIYIYIGVIHSNVCLPHCTTRPSRGFVNVQRIEYQGLYSFPRAAVTKDHKRGGLK